MFKLKLHLRCVKKASESNYNGRKITNFCTHYLLCYEGSQLNDFSIWTLNDPSSALHHFGNRFSKSSFKSCMQNAPSNFFLLWFYKVKMFFYPYFSNGMLSTWIKIFSRINLFSLIRLQLCSWDPHDFPIIFLFLVLSGIQGCLCCVWIHRLFEKSSEAEEALDPSNWRL